MSMKSNTRMPSIIFNPLILVILPFGSSIMDKTKCFQVDSNYGNEKKKKREEVICFQLTLKFLQGVEEVQICSHKTK